MEYVFVAVIIAAVFGICWLVDKGFARIFRSKAQHQSGLAVRLNKRYGSMGLILALLGIAATVYSFPDNTTLRVGGIILFLLGAGLTVYYLTFGIFYDADGFILTTFGKKSKLYRYRDIDCQQLYLVTGGNTTIELHMIDGRSVMLHKMMPDSDRFLDYAFGRWCAEKGLDSAACDFYDRENCRWFPEKEVLF